MKHFWNGEWIPDSELDSRLQGLLGAMPAELELDLSREVLLAACGALYQRLSPGEALYERVVQACPGHSDVGDAIEEVREFFQPASLELKLEREFKEPRPEQFKRVDTTDQVFEAWSPLGLLVHVAPANALSVGPVTVLEGLLAGNLNLLKVPGDDPPFAATILEGLVEASAGKLASFIKVVSISSAQRARLQRIMDAADGVAVWGGDAAVESIAQMVPPGVRVIDWGHKISFAYLCREHWDDESVLEALARDCCKYDQQLCTSPQAIYLETSSYSELQAFAKRFGPVLERVSSQYSLQDMDDRDWAEITSLCEIHKREGILGEVQCEVVEPADRAWRLLLDARPALMPSPLFRTLWLKPLPQESIVATLRPMRRYLQTVGLGSGPEETAQLVRRMVHAGVERVTTIGSMLESYPGEAHDGVYALQRYSRRTGLRLGDWAAELSHLGEK